MKKLPASIAALVTTTSIADKLLVALEKQRAKLIKAVEKAILANGAAKFCDAAGDSDEKENGISVTFLHKNGGTGEAIVSEVRAYGDAVEVLLVDDFEFPMLFLSDLDSASLVSLAKNVTLSLDDAAMAKKKAKRKKS
jgi:hypothetical protein